LAVRFTEFFLAGGFLVFFFAETFRLVGVTLRTTSLVVSPIDFCAAPALAARLPSVEPMVSATLTSNPLLLSSALFPSVMCSPGLLGYAKKLESCKECAPAFYCQRLRIVRTYTAKLSMISRGYYKPGAKR
jgi:hypothetical protein